MWVCSTCASRHCRTASTSSKRSSQKRRRRNKATDALSTSWPGSSWPSAPLALLGFYVVAARENSAFPGVFDALCAGMTGPESCVLILRSRPPGRAAERADDAIEEGLRDALIAEELEDACELARRHVGGHARILAQNDAEVAPFR